MTLALFYGMAAQKFQMPPYGFVKNIYSQIQVLKFTEKSQIPKPPQKTPNIPIQTPEERRTTPEEYFETDVAGLITIKQEQDVFRLRKKIITFVWGSPSLPSTLPAVVENNIVDTRYSDISSLSRIDELTIKMDFGLEVYIYHFIPKVPNHKVVIYHQGHENDFGDFYTGKAEITQLLNAGYSVTALSMPLWGLNNQPTVQIPRQGQLKLTRHDQLEFLLPENGSPIKYFIEPVVVLLNYLENDFDYSSVSMFGISGGGWTTTLAAAIDTRIEKSFPVAGSLPMYLRSNSNSDWSDYEQTALELFMKVNYLELYILGSSGHGRKQLQILNQFDACCFAGTKSETYKDIVSERVHELGSGEFDLFLDATHKKHIISETAMRRILDELNSTK